MKLSDKFTYYILCEDKQMQCFCRYFLQFQNINKRKIVLEKLPSNGCGEQYVKEQLPKTIELCFKVKNYDNNVLIVSTDADVNTVSKKKERLLKECENAKINVCISDKCILWFIPKRNIETWINYFSTKNADSINENDNYPHMRQHEADCKPAVKKMSDCFQKGEKKNCSLPSLQSAYKDFKKVVLIQKKKLVEN